MRNEPFWQNKALHQFSEAEWEALCDGCARCCLIKFQDEDSDEIYITRVACKLLDIHRCRCTDYANRVVLVPTCLKLTPELISKLSWIPETCAYRLLFEGKPLRKWHYLVSGDRESVHRAKKSIRQYAISESSIDPDQIEDYIDEIKG